ncbi:MAG: PQQ-binding-like beta-propeller repeat protein, partial [Verrucomicrobiales bacterium]
VDGVTAVGAGEGDWNQWRGAGRNGIVLDATPLADSWPEEGPPLLWESEPIPSDHYGGHGSAVVSDDKVFMALVWHRDVPTETRAIDHRVLAKLGFRGTNFSDELKARLEGARLDRNPRLRGSAFDAWAKSWVEENLDHDQQMSLGSWCISRLRAGSDALSFKDFDKLLEVRSRRFASHDEMAAWIDERSFSPEVAARIVEAVPNTRLAAQEVILALDAQTGETIWKAAFESEETARSGSSTPSVINGRVYAVLRQTLYCLDAASGKLLWKSPTPAIAPASCPLVVDGKVVILAGRLVAYGVETGEKLWEQEAFSGQNASPVAWEVDDRGFIACNARDALVIVDARSGDVVERIEGGGDATPVVEGEFLVVFSSKKPGEGLHAFRLNDAGDGLEKLWTHNWDSRRKHSSPLIYEGHVYLVGGDRLMCVELVSGEIRWSEDRKLSISSPSIADGKIYFLESNGNFLTMLEASPEELVELGRARVRGLACPSPTISKGKIFVRKADKLASFDLRD